MDLDGPVHVADFGGSGRPIVLVHGIGGSHVNFFAVADGMAQLGRTYAVDLIGYGYTPPAGRISDLRSNRRLLVRLVREVIGEPTVLLGTSLGGLLALLTAGPAHELVAGLVLVGPGQPYPRGVPINWPYALEFVALMLPVVGPAIARWRFHRAPEELAELTLSMVCHDASCVPDDVRQAYVAMAHERARMPWATQAFRQSARSLVRELRRPTGYERYVQRLRAPTIIIHGEEDRLVAHEASRRLAAMRPDWRLEMLPNVGHSPQLEAPEELVRLVADWLDATASPPSAEEAVQPR